MHIFVIFRFGFKFLDLLIKTCDKKWKVTTKITKKTVMFCIFGSFNSTQIYRAIKSKAFKEKQRVGWHFLFNNDYKDLNSLKEGLFYTTLAIRSGFQTCYNILLSKNHAFPQSTYCVIKHNDLNFTYFSEKSKAKPRFLYIPLEPYIFLSLQCSKNF